MTSPPKFGFRLMLRKVRIGISASRRVDRHTAAIRVLEPDHIVDIRKLRQQLGLDALDREVHHPGDALHGGA